VEDETGAVSFENPLLSFVDGAISRVAQRPLKVRGKVTPGNAVRGRIDVLVLEVGEAKLDRLDVERVLVRAEDVHVAAGIQPRLRAENVGLKVTIVQEAIDRWTRANRIPARLHLTDDGLVATMDVRGRKLSEVDVDMDVDGSFITLRPVRAAIFSRAAPVLPGMRWYLPLRLPAEARLRTVEHGEGTLTAYLDLPAVDEAITPALARELRRRVAPLMRSLGASAVRAALRR
jgi:hypothetical protein